MGLQSIEGRGFMALCWAFKEGSCALGRSPMWNNRLAPTGKGTTDSSPSCISYLRDYCTRQNIALEVWWLDGGNW